eukprot:Em0001g3007a
MFYEKTGLYPLDPEQVDYSKCVKDQQVREIENAEELTIDDCGLLHLRTGRRFLEERIGHDKLQMFESQYGGEWLGDVEDTSLFLLWSKLQDDIRSSEHDLSSENLQEASHPSDALQEASHPSDALQDASHPSDALQDASHPSDALQEASHPSDALQDASHPSDALQDASHPSDALQEASHPSDTIPTEDLAAELLHSNDSCSPSISNSMADNIESSYETSAAIDPPCDSSNVTLTSFVPDVSEPPITSGLSNVKQSQLPSAVTPILTKHLVERLVSLSKPANKIGKKRNRPLSCGVYALTSKRWRELREAEEQEKLLKKSKKGKAKKEKGVGNASFTRLTDDSGEVNLSQTLVQYKPLDRVHLGWSDTCSGEGTEGVCGLCIPTKSCSSGLCLAMQPSLDQINKGISQIAHSKMFTARCPQPHAAQNCMTAVVIDVNAFEPETIISIFSVAVTLRPKWGKVPCEQQLDMDLLLDTNLKKSKEFSNTCIIQVACCCICIIQHVQHVIKYSVEMRITIICTYTYRSILMLLMGLCAYSMLSSDRPCGCGEALVGGDGGDGGSSD